jgi:hypothetical protein
MGIFERGGLFGGVAHFDLRERDGAFTLFAGCAPLRQMSGLGPSDGRRRLTERGAMSHSATFGFAKIHKFVIAKHRDDSRRQASPGGPFA